MKNFVLFFFLLFVVIKLNAQAPILQAQRALGGRENDFGFCIQQTSDGGYITAGETASNNGNVHGNHGDEDFWVVKLDKSGIIQWQKPLGGFEDEAAFAVQQTSDGGYIVAGEASSFNGDVTGNHGNLDFWVVKLDANGNIIWEKSLGGSDADFATSVQQTRDGGYIVAGGTNSNDKQVSGNHGATDEWVVKLDANGNIQWKKTYGGSANETVYSIRQTSDGGYITAGNSNSNNGDVSGVHDLVYGDFWITKLDRIGNIVWQKTYGGNDYDLANSIQLTQDGGYVAAGFSRSTNGDITNNHGNYDFWIIKIDASGNLQWQKSFGGTEGDLAYSITLTDDHGYVVAGGSISNNGDVSGNHGAEDFWIIKIDSTGNLKWQKSLGGSSYEEAKSIVQTRDGGYAATGFTQSNNGDVTNNHGNYDVWIVKLSADAQLQSISSSDLSSKNILLQVSPNPATSSINIDLSSLEKNIQLSIANSNGYTFIQKNISKSTNEYHLQLDISKLPASVYYVYLKTKNNIMSRKFIKE